MYISTLINTQNDQTQTLDPWVLLHFDRTSFQFIKTLVFTSSSSPLMASVSHNLLNITITVILLFFVYCNKEIIVMAVAAGNISDNDNDGQATATDHDIHVNDDEEFNPSFDEHFYVEWADTHVIRRHQSNVIQLNFDQASGAAIGSRNRYGSGYFHLRMKVPGINSAGVVTSFYMTSHGPRRNEIDFEFLGNENGRPLSLQTNVWVNGTGGREEAINLWFDPSADFHTYKIQWNQHQIVFYVDNTPIRVYRNKTEFGIGYPTKPMQVEASIWNGEGWVYGGVQIHWEFAPFIALYRGFNISDACISNTATYSENCDSDQFWWNREDHWTLDARKQRQLQDVRNRYLIYDYCTDNVRYPVPLPECLH